MSTAFLFPGQGSQQTEMRDRVLAARPDLLAVAKEVVGADPFERLHEGTAYLQPAIYCASLASITRLEGPDADMMAGHSMGELTALVAAGSVNEYDGLALAATRGRLMQQAAEQGPEGAMLALGTDAESALELTRSHGLVVANDNAPDQVVLSGEVEAILAARADAKRSGLRAFRLPIKGAFHSPALVSVTPEFKAALERVEIRPPMVPVFSCVTAREFDDIPARLAESLTHGVRWREVLLALVARGVSRFVELGPGRVLTKIVRSSLSDVEALAVDEMETARA